MRETLEKIYQKAKNDLSSVSNKKDLEDFEIRYLGRQGELSELAKKMKDIPAASRPEAGKAFNEIKIKITSLVEAKRSEFEKLEEKKSGGIAFDYTLPGKKFPQGHLHPITQIMDEVSDFFSSMGFLVLDGPEVELDYYNFEGLNIPKDHPARDMQDTFYTLDGNVLRTHTSSFQVRTMREYGAPVRAIISGRCFRNEATDVRHEHTFFQFDAIFIDQNASLSHLKAILEKFSQNLFGEKTKVRLRPKFYPFVEPGVNGEVTCFLCKGGGCRLCKKTGWLEVLGAGLIHPNVLKEGRIDPKKYQGLAFAFGLDRLVMLRQMIEDIRLFQSGDMRFLEQF